MSASCQGNKASAHPAATRHRHNPHSRLFPLSSLAPRVCTMYQVPYANNAPHHIALIGVA